MTPLGEFVEQQIRQRHMSDREFARLVGVSNSTIARVRMEDPPEPTFDFLRKLSKATGHSLATLVKLAFPDFDTPAGCARRQDHRRDPDPAAPLTPGALSYGFSRYTFTIVSYLHPFLRG